MDNSCVRIHIMDERYKKLTLGGGLTLLIVPMKGVESVTVLVMVRTGSRDEPKKLAGISHFLEHMVFKGTKKYPTPFSITSEIDAIGGEFNAFTSKEYTGFYVKIAAKHLEKGVDVLSQMLTQPLLQKDAIMREKGVVIEEINMYEDLPMRKVSMLFDKLLFGENGVGRETIGSKRTVSGLSRKDLVTYLDSRYTTGRTVVGLVGGVGEGDKVRRKLEEMVSKKFSGLESDSNSRWKGRVKIGNKRKRLVLFKKETEQAHFVLGVPSFARGHRDRFALSILATILGGNMSSRLFSEVREKRGLAYYVKTDLDAYFDIGSFTVHAGVDVKKTEEAVSVSLGELLKMREKGSKEKGGVTTGELERAKEYLKGRLILELEDSHEVADLYVRRFLLERKILSPKQLIERVDKVQRGDVVRVARKLFKPGKLHLSVVGPYSEKKLAQRFKKILAS
jgi:predicted Zn-dependent peptidase